MSKLNWNNLTKEERAEYMLFQMSPRYGGRSAYLPDDCSGCGVCGNPMLGSGWCWSCYRRYNKLRDKLETS